MAGSFGISCQTTSNYIIIRYSRRRRFPQFQNFVYENDEGPSLPPSLSRHKRQLSDADESIKSVVLMDA